MLDDSSTQSFIRSIINNAYGLNVYRVGSAPYNCDLYTISGNETDAEIVINPLSDGSFEIKLKNYNYYLTATGTGNGANVKWAAQSQNNSLQHWTFTKLS